MTTVRQWVRFLLIDFQKASRSSRFPNEFNIIRFKSDSGRKTLQYRGPLNRLVKVPKNFYSYKQILKKHAKDIAGFSFSKEATLITCTAKKDDFRYF